MVIVYLGIWLYKCNLNKKCNLNGDTKKIIVLSVVLIIEVFSICSKFTRMLKIYVNNRTNKRM